MTSQIMALHLRKSLYGLRQSGNNWYGTLKDIMISIGFVGLHLDGGLFVLENQGTVVAAVILYINDLLIIANDVVQWLVLE